jgi:hypothetical protein
VLDQISFRIEGLSAYFPGTSLQVPDDSGKDRDPGDRPLAEFSLTIMIAKLSEML